MILVYTVGLLLLGVASFITARQARRLERKYVQVAKQADTLAKALSMKEGNSNRVNDPCTVARQHYELGRVVQIRDRLETKYNKWENRSEKFGRLRTAFLNWKGRFVPYMLGIVDVAAVVFTLTYAGVIEEFKPRDWVDQVVVAMKK